MMDTIDNVVNAVTILIEERLGVEVLAVVIRTLIGMELMRMTRWLVLYMRDVHTHILQRSLILI